MSDKMREAMIDQDGAVWEKIGGAWDQPFRGLVKLGWIVEVKK